MILDPFMGSGTTIKVAKRLNRNAVGIEIVQKYYENVRDNITEKQCCLLERRSKYETVKHRRNKKVRRK